MSPPGDGIVASPTGVPGVRGAAALAAGAEHPCALAGSGRAYCWGANSDGALGDGSTSDRRAPVGVQVPQGLRDLAAGDRFTCGLAQSGGVLCWGSNDGLVLGEAPPSSDPDDGGVREVRGVDSVQSLAAGSGFTCAVVQSGEVECWGDNASGQLGVASPAQTKKPVTVRGIAEAVEVVAGRAHACARLRSGAVVCWGANDLGQLGDGSTKGRSVPAPVQGLADAVELVGGSDHNCARRRGGYDQCVGARATASSTAASPRQPPPALVQGLSGAAELASGNEHTCARVGASVLCWGNNFRGQLGDGAASSGASTSNPRPLRVVKIDDAKPHRRGPSTCVRRSNGMAACSGAAAPAGPSAAAPRPTRSPGCRSRTSSASPRSRPAIITPAP
ncbi:MAG: hypothetical protein R3B09_11985 [Nannocystaceae bacterium]